MKCGPWRWLPRTQIRTGDERCRGSSNWCGRGEWQAYLHDVYSAHNKVCQLTFDKQDELRRSGSSFRNLGPQQIAITEKHDQQSKAAQDELSVQVARQRQIQKKFAEMRYANAFAAIQGTRMVGGFCSQAKVIYPQIR